MQNFAETKMKNAFATEFHCFSKTSLKPCNVSQLYPSSIKQHQIKCYPKSTKMLISFLLPVTSHFCVHPKRARGASSASSQPAHRSTTSIIIFNFVRCSARNFTIVWKPEYFQFFLMFSRAAESSSSVDRVPKKILTI